MRHEQPAAAVRSRRPRSLERKLPLIMTALLAVMLAGSLALTYVTLTHVATVTAAERLDRAAGQLGMLAHAMTSRLGDGLARAAQSDVLRRALAAPPGSPAQAAASASLDLLLTPGDSGLTVELWSADGRLVAFAGQALRPGGEGERWPAAARAGVPGTLAGFESPEDPDAPDTVRIGALHLDGGVPHYWIVAPVHERGATRGWLARRFRMATRSGVDETLRALTGSDVTAYYRNADGGLWTTLDGQRASAPVARRVTRYGPMVERPGVGRLLLAEVPLAGTPMVLALERPLRSVLAEPRGMVRQLAIASVLLAIAGALAAHIVSRTITGPLVALTDAAEKVARGDYEARVLASGDDEITRLAESFNRMAHHVGAARRELQTQTEEARATAAELERANRELAVALQHVEEGEAQFRALADAIAQLSWMMHADGSVFWFNERWYAYTGTTPETMLGWGWRSVHDPAVLPHFLERWSASLSTGTPFEMEFPLRGADGTYRWFLTRIQPVRDADGRVVRWFGTGTDVQALRDAREAATAANRAKSEFLAVMSHELRTPLNAIGGYTELLELGLRGPVTEAQKRDLARIRANQQHLLGLISGVLDLSRIEAGRVAYDPQPIALGPFLAGLDSLVEPQAAAKSLTLEHVPCSPTLGVHADREKLRQILLNLLSNAIRYTPAGGRIVLAAEAMDERTVAITVDDTGIGIAPEQAARIFEPFVQLDRSLTQVRDGVGLGLAISLDLARGMGGDISVESEPGVGSTFTVTLPRVTVPEGAEMSSSSDEFPVVRERAAGA